MQPWWRTPRPALQVANPESLRDLASPLLGVYPRKVKTYVFTKHFTDVFITYSQ